jgi:hypothetical protein
VAALLAAFLAAASGCGSNAPPKAPKLRIEGPAGMMVGYSVSYFDGPGNVEFKGTAKTIPESGVYTEDLAAGHQGLLLQVTPNGPGKVTVILLDGDKEVRRATAKGDKDTAEVKIGKVEAVGPFGGR